MKRQDKYAAQSAWRKRNPWARLVEWARRRCSDPEHKSAKNYDGVKVTLTAKEAKALWDRDGAAAMRTPSLDRKDATLGYTFDNCRVIEKSINERLPHDAALRAEIDGEGETLPGWVTENELCADGGCRYA